MTNGLLIDAARSAFANVGLNMHKATWMYPGVGTAGALLSAAAILILGGCATTGEKQVSECTYPSPAVAAANPPAPALTGAALARYEFTRKKIDTCPVFHHAAIAHNSYESPDPLYLLGFEKLPDKSERPYCANGDPNCAAPVFDVNGFNGLPGDADAVQKTREATRKQLFEERPLALTHALRIRRLSAAAKENQDACFIFNVYGEADALPMCRHRHAANSEKSGWSRQGWKALDRLADEIREAVSRDKTTHIIVLATGWDTSEYESYQDFLSWAKNLREDFAGQEFRPLYVGIAWESRFCKIPAVGSFTTKGNDADEIGFAWGNYLINDLLAPIAKASGAKLVALGHSFGSRIVFGAHYARDVLVRKSPAPGAAITLIGLQAAFPVGRFVSTEGKDDEHLYLAANKGTARVVVTTSVHDTANGKMSNGSGYVGGPGGLNTLKEKSNIYGPAMALSSTNAKGEPLSSPDAVKVTVYDASPFVDCQLPGTNSGAHSDIYDVEMGHFLGATIRSTEK